MPRPTHLEIIPLGGLGEFGLNLTVFRWGRACLIVDAGMMFPGAEHPGVEMVVPDLSFLDDCGDLLGVLLTHGHEDHIGAVPFLLAGYDVPLYAAPYASELLRHRLAERGLEQAATLRPLAADGDSLRLGPFTVETLPVSHSIPHSSMLVIETPVGTVVHTADFRLEPGRATINERLARLGRTGVLLLLSDSTNADRDGTTPGESSVTAGLDALIGSTRGRVVVTTFASNVERIATLGRLARRHGRKLCIAGASMQLHAEVGSRLGLLPLPSGTRVSVEQAANLSADRLVVAAGGSQGEPASTMARIAVGAHRELQLAPGDLMIHSARQIPGNAKRIGRMIDHCLRRGAEVVTAEQAPVHVSGHAARDELRSVLDLLRPRFLVPIHGEYRQLQAHARLALDGGMARQDVLLAESGDRLLLDAGRLFVADQVEVGQIFLDSASDRVHPDLLRDRRRIAAEGIVVPVVAVRRDSGLVDGFPRVVTSGFVPAGDGSGDNLMGQAHKAVVAALRAATPEERAGEGLLEARIESELRRLLRRETGRRPLVVPVIVEL